MKKYALASQASFLERVSTPISLFTRVSASYLIQKTQSTYRPIDRLVIRLPPPLHSLLHFVLIFTLDLRRRSSLDITPCQQTDRQTDTSINHEPV